MGVIWMVSVFAPEVHAMIGVLSWKYEVRHQKRFLIEDLTAKNIGRATEQISRFLQRELEIAWGKHGGSKS